MHLPGSIDLPANCYDLAMDLPGRSWGTKWDLRPICARVEPQLRPIESMEKEGWTVCCIIDFLRKMGLKSYKNMMWIMWTPLL
jgi:hypothetical protein